MDIIISPEVVEYHLNMQKLYRDELEDILLEIEDGDYVAVENEEAIRVKTFKGFEFSIQKILTEEEEEEEKKPVPEKQEEVKEPVKKEPKEMNLLDGLKLVKRNDIEGFGDD